MPQQIWKASDINTSQYSNRSKEREVTLMRATMNFVGYFMSLGDTQLIAEGKVGDVSDLVAIHLYPYVLGRTQNLIDAINGIDEIALPFMGLDAKAFLITELTI